MPSISLILCTARANYSIIGLPNLHIFEPTFNALQNQMFKDFELIVVDALYPERKEWLEKDRGFPVKYVPVHPNHRFWLDRKRWQICGALNTGIIHAMGELLVRIDDASEFQEDFLQKFWDGYRSGLFPLAMHVRFLEGKPARFGQEYRDKGYESKYEERLQVLEKDEREATLRRLYGDEGLIRDTRYPIVKARGGKMIAPPEWYYGYSSMSLEAALKINGYNELMDADKGQEDQECGLRLTMAGYRNMFSLDVDHQVIEHEHLPPSSDVILPDQPNIKCLPPQERIFADGHPTAISKIIEGNMVLSSKGTYNRVKKILTRKSREKLICIVPFYTNIPLTVSCDHPVFIFRDGELLWIEARLINTRDYLVYPRFSENEPQPLFLPIPMNKLSRKPRKDRVQVTSELMKLIGYYLGEGSSTLSTSNVVCFSFRKEELNLVEDVERLMLKMFNISPTSSKKESTAWVIRYGSLSLTKFFKENCGGCSPEKKLPNALLKLEEECCKELLRSFYLSEGITKQPSYRVAGGYYVMNTCSEVLAYQIRLLFHKLGMPIKLWRREPNIENYSIINGRKVSPKRTMFYLQVPSAYEDIMQEITGVPYPKRSRRLHFKSPHTIVDEHYIYTKVRKIEEIDYEGELYNLEVDGGTYTAEGIIVHNCNYAIFLLNRMKNQWRANSELLTEENLKFIVTETLRPPCSPRQGMYQDECKGELFKLWANHQPIFDLREERLNI